MECCKAFEYWRELFGDEPKCELNYRTDVELLVAVILSAQCTDKRVNIVTRTLFETYKTIYDFANADWEELGCEIRSTGFYRNKAQNIIEMAKAVCENHGGEIPNTMEELVKLRGVGRKTASVFLAQIYKIPTIAVDTHVARVARRLDYTQSRNPLQIECDLKKLFIPDKWCRLHLYMVLFGRYHCTARNPKCADCKLQKQCRYFCMEEKHL